jgi:phosphoglucosamine mutase
MNAETVAGATYALVSYQQDNHEQGPVVVARDTRPSGERLREAAICGALAGGAEVIDLDIAPTPAAQKIASEVGAMATVVITASHNPAKDNGWKGMPGHDKPAKDVVQAVSDRYWHQVDNGLVIPHDKVGEVSKRPDLLEGYSREVVASIAREFGDKPLGGRLFVVDGAYGAAQKITPDIFRQLGAEVAEFCCDGQGVINDNCGAADLRGLKRFLSQHSEITGDPRFVGAVANDGDADRVMGIGMNTQGEPVEINGNHMMRALAEGQPGIVGTEYTNSALVKHLEEQNVGFADCPNGDVYVTEALRKKQNQSRPWRRGGEFTGHLVDMDWLPSGDGVRMAAWYASYVVSKGWDFGQAHDDLPLWAETMRKISLGGADQHAVVGSPEVADALAKARSRLGDDGRIVFRPSGTEPVVRVWGESPDAQRIDGVVDVLSSAVQSRIHAAQLSFKQSVWS